MQKKVVAVSLHCAVCMKQISLVCLQRLFLKCIEVSVCIKIIPSYSDVTFYSETFKNIRMMGECFAYKILVLILSR